MKRRTLLHNLFSSMLAVPVLGAYERALGHSVIEPDDERHMRRAIQLAGNVPKYPFGALLVDQKEWWLERDGIVQFTIRRGTARWMRSINARRRIRRLIGAG